MTWKRKSYRARTKSGKGNFNKAFGKQGLHHQFGSGFSFTVNSETKNTMVLPLLACDSTLGNPDSVYVNKRHPSVTNSNDHLTYGSSVVKRIHANIMMNIDSRITQDVEKVRVMCMPICLKYDDLDKESGGNQLGTYLPVVEHTGDEKIRPAWSATQFDSEIGNFYDSDGMATAIHESVAFSVDDFETALAENPISPLLQSVTRGIRKHGGLEAFDLHRQNGGFVFNGMIPVPKKVQLQTEHTFFGMLIHIPVANDRHQYFRTGEISTNPYVNINYDFSFYEWNKEFNQNVS